MIIKSKTIFKQQKYFTSQKGSHFRSLLILFASDTLVFMSPPQLMMTNNDTEGVFQITVDLKSIQIKIKFLQMLIQSVI